MAWIKDRIEAEHRKHGKTLDWAQLAEKKVLSGLVDKIQLLAELEHKQWGHWTKYFIENNGALNRLRWKRQMATDYKDLTREEKESDIVWAREVIKIILSEPPPIPEDPTKKVEESKKGVENEEANKESRS